MGSYGIHWKAETVADAHQNLQPKRCRYQSGKKQVTIHVIFLNIKDFLVMLRNDKPDSVKLIFDNLRGGALRKKLNHLEADVAFFHMTV